MMQAMRIAALTRWEWFKLRRRWLPWLMSGIMAVIVQLSFWLPAAFGPDGITRRSVPEKIANGLDISDAYVVLIALILASR